jgi:hypothetical protein
MTTLEAPLFAWTTFCAPEWEPNTVNEPDPDWSVKLRVKVTDGVVLVWRKAASTLIAAVVKVALEPNEALVPPLSAAVPVDQLPPLLIAVDPPLPVQTTWA